MRHPVRLTKSAALALLATLSLIAVSAMAAPLNMQDGPKGGQAPKGWKWVLRAVCKPPANGSADLPWLPMPTAFFRTKPKRR